MKLEQLKQIISVADHGSISGAAADMYISHSTLSSSLRAAEQELGSAVFIRHTNGVELTGFGRKVYEHAKLITEEMEVFHKLNMEEGEDVEYLTIAHMHDPLCGAAMADMYQMHAGTSLMYEIKQVDGMQVVEMVSLGKADAGVLTVFPQVKSMYINAIQAHDLKYEKLMTGHIKLVSRGTGLAEQGDAGTNGIPAGRPFAYYDDLINETPVVKRMSKTDERSGHSMIGLGDKNELIDFIKNTDAFTIDLFGEFADDGFLTSEMLGEDMQTELLLVTAAVDMQAPQTSEYIGFLREQTKKMSKQLRK